jgi:hypothetical protein
MTDIKLIGNYYNDSNSLRIAISSIPKIGSYIDQYLSSKGQEFAQQRVEYLIEQLQIEMEAVQESLINTGLFNSEIGFDITQKAFLAASRTRQKEKLNLFAKVLRGAFTTHKEIHDPELYLRIIDELSERELEIAFLLYDVKEVKKIKIEGINDTKDGATYDASWFSQRYNQFTKEEFEYILPRLEKTGIIKEKVGFYVGYGGGEFNITPLFKNFKNFINFIDNKDTLNK